MKTLESLIAGIDQRISTKLGERAGHSAKIDEVRTACLGENRDPSETEAQVVADAQTARAAIDAEVETLKAQRAEYVAEQERDAAADKLQREFQPGADKPAYDKVARTGQEPRTYTRAKDRSGEARFFSDAFNAQRGVAAARERIERHGQEVMVEREMSERALNTGGIAGLTVPQYLVDMAAPVLRAARPIANVCAHHELPDSGMSLVIPRGTTGGSAAAQNGENTAVSNTDEVWANLTVPVVTAAGQAPVSRQVLERGEQMDEIIFGDLGRAHASVVGNYIVNGSGASGQPLGILNTAGIGAATAFGAAATAANFGLKVAGASYNVTSQGAGLFPKFLFMHPRRWAWMTGLVDSANRPIVEVSNTGLYNALAQILKAGQISADGDNFFTAAEVIGTHNSGLPVITDLNIPTNVGTNSEDVVLAADTNELHLWEDGDGMPRQLSFEQTAGNNLTTTLVVYSYLAFTAGRYPGATAKVGGLDTVAGQGLIAPTF